LAALLCAAPALGGERLTASGGLSAVEGAAGGGIVPWAVLSGTGTEDELGGALSTTLVRVDDFHLTALGAAATLRNRAELSVAVHWLDALPLDAQLRQLVVGAKLRLHGDLIYGRAPQLALGLQYKRQLDFALPAAVGARDPDGVDVYLAASKLWLDGVLGRSVLVSAAVRATRANQLGLLGFGGDGRSDTSVVFEGSAALFLTRELALGYEFRQKPDNLRFAREDDWHDVFVAYFPHKRIGVVASYARLGGIAGFARQDGLFASLQASY
jgi:hypothetical protein